MWTRGRCHQVVLATVKIVFHSVLRYLDILVLNVSEDYPVKSDSNNALIVYRCWCEVMVI
jgi:hypothetical protein